MNRLNLGFYIIGNQTDHIPGQTIIHKEFKNDDILIKYRIQFNLSRNCYLLSIRSIYKQYFSIHNSMI